MKAVDWVFLLVILSVVPGCKRVSDGNNTSLPVLDMGATIGKQVPDTFTWNSVAKKITYVPISTSPDALFVWWTIKRVLFFIRIRPEK